MIRRIVHLSFREEAIESFLSIFEESCQAIRTFPGCCELTLLQDAEQPGRFTTCSLWDDEAALEAYRQSDLFRSTWDRTKVLFADRPSAISFRIVRHLD